MSTEMRIFINDGVVKIWTEDEALFQTTRKRFSGPVEWVNAPLDLPDDASAEEWLEHYRRQGFLPLEMGSFR